MTIGYIFVPDGSMPDGSMPGGSAMDAKKNVILTALKTRLGQISTANGYLTNIANIDEWRVTPWSQSDLPAVNLRDEEETIEFSTISELSCLLPVAIVLTIDGEASPTDARKMAADIIYALGHNAANELELTLDGAVLNTSVENSRTAVEHTENKTTAITVFVRLEYTTSIYDVYARP